MHIPDLESPFSGADFPGEPMSNFKGAHGVFEAILTRAKRSY